MILKNISTFSIDKEIGCRFFNVSNMNSVMKHSYDVLSRVHISILPKIGALNCFRYREQEYSFDNFSGEHWSTAHDFFQADLFNLESSTK